MEKEQWRIERQHRIQVAEETLEILEAGRYTLPSGERISIKEELHHVLLQSVLYRPQMFAEVVKKVSEREPFNQLPQIEVTKETTISAARRLVEEEGRKDVVCLNFAAARIPGGGFLDGARAQEESLCRASGLYATIALQDEMYDYNRSRSTYLYSDYMIYSPAVPVFRDDQHQLLEHPYLASFITSPAVQAKKLREWEEESLPQIESVMTERIRKIIQVAIYHQHRTIVLGAFGCGAFGNDPVQISGCFHKVLVEEGYQRYFDKIVFAIFEQADDQPNRSTFKRVFVQ